MTKTEMIQDPNSCWNRADPDEPVFVLLGRDIASPDAIKAWWVQRILLRKNGPGDDQISSAKALADEMYYYCKKRQAVEDFINAQTNKG